jgi:hypothetical protein
VSRQLKPIGTYAAAIAIESHFPSTARLREVRSHFHESLALIEYDDGRVTGFKAATFREALVKIANYHAATAGLSIGNANRLFRLAAALRLPEPNETTMTNSSKRPTLSVSHKSGKSPAKPSEKAAPPKAAPKKPAKKATKPTPALPSSKAKKGQSVALKFARREGGTTVTEIIEATALTRKQGQALVTAMTEAGELRAEGSTKGRRYFAVEGK